MSPQKTTPEDSPGEFDCLRDLQLRCKHRTTLVSVVVPTLNRPKQLRRALASLNRQVAPDDVSLEILVVDNSPAGNAEATATDSADVSPWPVRYIREQQLGVAAVRNAGIGAARGDWVAFLDDDEEAEPDWIRRMVEAAEYAQADAAFGPVSARPDGPVAGHAGQHAALLPYFERSFHIPDGVEINKKAAYLGTNNSMFRRETCFDDGVPFDLRLNEAGGEDSLFLARLSRSDRTFVWASAARVTEWVPPARLSWDYVRRRKFLSGQIRSFVQAMLDPPRWTSVAMWMALGAVQAIAYGLLAGLCWPFARTKAQRFLASAAGGLGKVLWMDRFRLQLYGRGHTS